MEIKIGVGYYIAGFPAPNHLQKSDLGRIFDKRKGTLRDQFSIKLGTNLKKKDHF